MTARPPAAARVLGTRTRRASRATTSPAARFAARLLDRSSSVAKTLRRMGRTGRMSIEGIHELHRQLRRLRLELRLFRRLSSRKSAKQVTRIAQGLDSLNRAVGKVRDHDVMVGLLDAFTLRGATRTIQSAIRSARHQLREEALRSRRRLLTGFRSRSIQGLFTRLPKIVRRSGRTLSDHAFANRVSSELADFRSRMKKARRRTLQNPTPRRLHHLRKEIRNARDLVVGTHERSGPNASITSPIVQSLLRRLGRIHDFDVLGDALERSVRASHARPVHRLVNLEQRRLRDRAHRSLLRKKVARAIRGFPTAMTGSGPR